MVLKNPPKSLRQISLEKITSMTGKWMMTSSTRSFAISDIDATERQTQIESETDKCIRRIQDFLFGQLPVGIIDDLSDRLASMLTRKIKNKAIHDALDDRDVDCPHCHALQVLARMSRIFLDPRVRSLNLDLFDELMKKEIVKSGVQHLEGKRVLRLMVDRIPVCFAQFNMGFQNLTSLQYLTLDFGINNDTLAALGKHCPNLEHLEINYCMRLEDVGLASLSAGCKNLKNLLLTNALCISTEGFADAIVALPKLERLGRNVPLYSIICVVRQKYPNKTVSLKDLGSYGSIFKAGSDLDAIVQVCPNLSKIYVDSTDLSPLSGSKNLTSLHLMGVRDGPHHKNLIELLSLIGSQITTLEIKITLDLTRSDLEEIGRMCPRLKSLKLKDCGTAGDFSKVRVTDIFKSLNVLYFSPKLPETSMSVHTAVFFLTNALNVEEVYIEGCPELSDEHLKKVLELGGLACLRILQLASIGYQSYAGLTLASMEALMESCQRLEELGNMNKWNVEYKLFKGYKKYFKEKNFKLRLSNESMREILIARPYL
jgi:hypothetical protein